MPHLINLPPFMYKSIDVGKLNIFQKLLFIIKGKLVSYIIKHTNKKLFCILMNTLFRKVGILDYSNSYYSYTTKDRSIYFPNKRIVRHVNNYPNQLDILFKSYCLDFIQFTKNDVVVDCGANIGELKIAFEIKKINIDYIAFEPDKETFECLQLNLKGTNSKTFNLALHNSTGETSFYLDNEGGNSSLVNFGTKNQITINTSRLDQIENLKDNVKLLKIDAEGNEPEVLEGCIGILKNIEYISVDFGDERGVDQNTTIIDVNKFMYDNNFSLVKFSEYRLIGLYKNNFDGS